MRLLRLVVVLLFSGLLGGAQAAALKLRVVQATWSKDYPPGRAIISLDFEPSALQSLAGFTTNAIGRKVELRFQGEVIHSPIVREPILGAGVIMTGDFSEEEAERLTLKLSGGEIEIDLASD